MDSELDSPAPPPPPPSQQRRSPSYGNKRAEEGEAAAMREEGDDDDEEEEDEDGGLPLGREDPVVKEIPVYLSTELAQQLHVIQYPNRPFYRPYEAPAAARVKPANKLLELEYALPPSSEHLDEEAPRHLRLERIKVQSSYLDPMTTYAVGTMRGDALHLTPLAGIYQMRASCEHVDAATEEDGVEGMLAEDEDSEGEEGAGGGRGRAGAAAASSSAAGAAQVPVKLQHIEYKKRESEKAAAARRTSYAYKRQQEEAELWTELAIHPQGSHASAQDWARLQCPAESRGRPIRFRGGSGVYVDLYRREMARVREEEARAGGGGGGGGSGGRGLGGVDVGGDGEVTVLADDKAAVLGGGLGEAHGGRGGGGGQGGHQVPIQQLTGAEQVAAVFERAHVVSFDMVLALANPSPLASGRDPTLPLLELVKKHAMLVRGNWVRKSSLCGLPRRLAAARDALLLLLVRYGGVNRMQLAQAAGLGDEEALALLQPLARLDKDRRMWVPASPDDAGFPQRYPEAVAQQAKAWRDREKDREVGAILAAVGAPDCPFLGPMEGGGVEGAAMVVDGGGGGGGGKGGGGKGRRKG